VVVTENYLGVEGLIMLASEGLNNSFCRSVATWTTPYL